MRVKDMCVCVLEIYKNYYLAFTLQHKLLGKSVLDVTIFYILKDLQELYIVLPYMVVTLISVTNKHMLML